MNRLAEESSPYLLQHAHNPVDWFPWGADAFTAARQQNKPIFLSVGYSSCYWCHVMERESFENPAIAAEMNRLLVNVKVDREERPDVDHLYMTAVQLLSRQAGWPMSVFLLPDGRPFFGGTYFPPTDAYGRHGFPALIRAITDAFKNRSADVESTAAQITKVLQDVAEPPLPKEPITIGGSFCNELVRASLADYDPRHGGFGGAPKFPRQTLLELLLVHDAIVPDANRMTLLARTLAAMADGGIRDHLGGAFHRYSTDAAWLVPHFEIMLYDNAMLGWIYAEASRRLKDERLARVARGIFDATLRDMTSPQGAFFTSIDAETDAREGATYLWTMDEIAAVLGAADAQRFAKIYGLDRGPNFADPHHGNGQADRNVLFLPNGPSHENDPDVAQMRQKLLDYRRSRKQPRTDDKILTSWNGLMIRALAHGSVVLNEPRYLEAASKAADFLLEHHRGKDGSLLRTSRGGPAKLPAHLDDYAFLIQALLELEAAGQSRRRGQAVDLADQMIARFGSRRGAFYFTQATADDLIVRQKLAIDSPLPSGNGVAAQILLALGKPAAAAATIKDFAAMLDDHGEAMSTLVQAAAIYVQANGPLEIPAATQAESPLPESPQRLAESIVSLSVEVFDEQTIELTLKIKDGYHINADEAPSPLVPTRLDVQSNAVTVKGIEYPWGIEKTSAPNGPPLRIFEKQAVILINLRPRNDGGVTVKLAVQYQPCDENSCLPPVTRTLEVNLPRTPHPKMPKSTKPDLGE